MMKNKEKRLSEQGASRRRWVAGLVDDNHRYRLQLSVVSALTGAAAALMCVLNVMSGNTLVILITLMFSVISFINVAIVSYSEHNLAVSSWLFSINVLILATYLLAFDTSDFGVFWICTIPAFAPLLLGRRNGTILSLVVCAVLLFFLWTPWGTPLLACSRTPEFARHVSLLYVVVLLIGYWFEFILSLTARELHVSRKRFREMSIRDTLTGLYNRHWISQEMPIIMKRCSGETRLAVMILDIDFFKKLNDSHGHLYGDAVLKKIANLLVEIVEPIGYVCRWGGEEFAVLAEGFDEARTVELAEQLRKAVEDMGILDENGNRQTVTISIGAVSMMPTADMRPDYLIDCADNALYAAKNSGRNAVHYYAGAWYYRDFDDGELPIV